MAVTQAMIDRAIRFEGSVPHMYLDTKGKVTVGVGHMLPSGVAAATLAYKLVGGGTAATPAQIKAEHALMLKQVIGKPATYYERFRTMEITPASSDTALQSDLAISEADLVSIFSGYVAFPAAAKEALIDMAFNLGKTNLLKFTALIKACQASDWANAAVECQRVDVSGERNDETRALFAGIPTPAAEGLAPALREAVWAISETLQVQSRAQGGLFPRGLGQIEVEVRLGGATVRFKATGANTPCSPAEPESCREARRMRAASLTPGQKVPNTSEAAASGAMVKKIKRTDPEFKMLVQNGNVDIVFKDEEGTGADRMMTTSMRDTLAVLAASVKAEWPGVKLRITEAWDEDNEHGGPNQTGPSLHYEGRAADLTTQPSDSTKLGRLGQLAVDAGFDWVWYENNAHIHVSVSA